MAKTEDSVDQREMNRFVVAIAVLMFADCALKICGYDGTLLRLGLNVSFNSTTQHAEHEDGSK